MTDAEIADRVRRLDMMAQTPRGSEAWLADPEAARVYDNLWTEYWSAADGLNWMLGRD